MRELFESGLIWLYLILILFVAFLAIFLRTGMNGRKKRARARVAAKRKKRAYRRVGSSDRTFGICIYEYYVTFLLEDGKEIERQCSECNYNEFQVGYEGLLTYDRHYIIAFDKSGRNFVYGEQ